MREAIMEGRKAVGICETNPPVGCVLVQHGQIISKGHTNASGQAHAEAMALSQVKGNLDDVVVFVTLEPCSFHGRTPSCAQELIDRGVRSVYVGIIDPHPKNRGAGNRGAGNRGAGIEKLEKAGVSVQLGILESEIKSDLESHLESHS